MSFKKKSLVIPTAQHEAFFQDMIVVMKKYNLPDDEMLAIASNFLGKLVAMQDQRKYTSEQAMAIVANNLQLGNAEMLEHFLGQVKGNA